MEPELFKDPPRLHYWEQNSPAADGQWGWTTGGFDGPQLERLVEFIRQNFPTPRIIETGCGNSTIAFLLCNPQKVVSISIDGVIFDRIAEYCAKRSIGTAPLVRMVGASEWELPRIAASGERFDFALIDGSHNWPLVFVDFCYINAMMTSGGLIMIDDIQLHTVRELANLLLEQPGFALETQISKSMIFRKTSDAASMPEWCHQPYIVSRSTPRTEAPSFRRGLSEVIRSMPYGVSMIAAVKKIGLR